MNSSATTSQINPLSSLPSPDSTYGAYLLGTNVSLILYGISLFQLYRYLRLYRTDALYIRVIIFAVMFLETVHVPMIIHTCYYLLVSNYANSQSFISPPPWSLKLSPALATIITFTAQMHVFCSPSVFANDLGSLSGFNRSNEWLFSAAIFPASVADGLLSGAIIVGLRRSRKTYTRVQSSHELFMLYVVKSGLFTGLINLLPSIMAVVQPKTYVWAATSFTPTRIYAMTLLCVLNSRERLVGRGLEIFGREASTRNIFARANHLAAVEQWNAPVMPDNEPTKIAINITAETESDMPGTASAKTFHSNHLAESIKTQGMACDDSL
ncbi:uncharacterized protein TRAVEDRAFT_48982 [Trametes versicolor FP-101664 SS1]|uniref:uncharacterized protein n=1 Tax=Trametes versicolor (strain FP-101664) TaxID=717944 RepID=UPI0004622D4C|nr:uncharacterized protein TRAVEDRAFT_48982 [Trametes versicolor FP-101664 SS1]EIW57958.1 hypothetical protein TRAVEDRAFT_48982 [Trametes versicolor FP-101664 SS1]